MTKYSWLHRPCYKLCTKCGNRNKCKSGKNVQKYRQQALWDMVGLDRHAEKK